MEEVPVPQIKDGHVLVQNICSLVSAGTERTSVETAQASMLGKAKSRPDLVAQVIDNVKREGVLATYNKVQNRLDNYKELGYSSAGIVIESAVDSIKVGDRVACAGTAHHAEVVAIPKNLIARIPDGVEFSEAAFTTLGAIALQGVRQADVKLGERVAVIGLGLIGLLTVQLLKAAGCRVVGLDIVDSNFPLAKQSGCDECVLSDASANSSIESFTHGHGTDAVIITASTSSNQPMELALQFARKRSSIVVVGTVGMDIPRSPFYEKELQLKISCSYGPGRYDPEYEMNGTDYPIGYVRWTENRNMEGFLDLVAQKKLDVQSLVTHRFPISEALNAYDLITGKNNEKNIGVLIDYPSVIAQHATKRVVTRSAAVPSTSEQIVIGFIGAGNFAQSYILPALADEKVRLKGVVTSHAVRAKTVARKFNFDYCSTDPQEVLDDKDTSVIFIATQHDTHAHYVLEAMKRGKHVFVEKPLAITQRELEDIREMMQSDKRHSASLTVGFNRRYSKSIQAMRSFFNVSREPFVMAYRVNAGSLPPTHWMQDDKQGGRIVGEACHFIDTMAFLSDSLPVRVFTESISSDNARVKQNENVNVSIRFANGSIGNLLYFANGDSSVPKEYLEVSSDGKTAIMNNFETVTFHEGGRKRSQRFDGKKGHREEVIHFLRVIAGKEKPMLQFDSIYRTTLATFKINESLQKGLPVELHD